MKTYCQSCGEATEFSIRAPVMCAYCGHSFSGATQSSPKAAAVVNPPARVAPAIRKPSARDSRRAEVMNVALDVDDDEPLDDDMDADIEHLTESISRVNPKTVFTVQTNKVNRSSLKDASAGIGGISQRLPEDNPQPKGKKQTAKQILKEFAQEAGSLRKK